MRSVAALAVAIAGIGVVAGTAAVLGSRPKIGAAFFRMLRTGSVPADFEFTFTPSTRLGFTGYARKRSVSA